MTHEQRARRYLQASMNAGYTNLPAERREAYEDQMRAHERAYPRVREHALAGADNDFDERLNAGEREHQRHLRRQDGLQEADVHRIRGELRGNTPKASRRARRPSGTTAGPRAAQRAVAAGGSAITAAASGGGNIVMYFIGGALLLSLFYLLVKGKGAGALTGIVNTIVGAAGAFVKPVDPVAAAQRALGASPTTPSGAGQANITAGGNPGPAAGGATAPPPGQVGSQLADRNAKARDVARGLHFKGVLEREVKEGVYTLPIADRVLKSTFPNYARETRELAGK